VREPGGKEPEVAAMADVSDVAEGLAAMTGAAVLGSLTIPGRPEHVCAARAYVAKLLGPESPLTDAVVLLTSEVVTNAVVHSNSRRPGGTVLLVVSETAGGLRIEVTDDGSDLTAPVVKGEPYSSDGHGLMLLQSLADQWGYLRGAAGTTVWFWLRPQPAG
jgi:anti-sigma regulatory factor (Ser/Thr protein kinase)